MRIALSVLLLAALSGCTTMARMEGVQGPGQTLTYQRGRGYLFSREAHSIVGIVPEEAEYQTGPRLRFLVRIENHGAWSFDVSEADIRAQESGKALAVIPATQLVEEVRRKASRARAGAAFAGAVNYANASKAGYSTYSGTATVSGPGGYNRATGNFWGSSYDAGKAWQAKQQANQQTAAHMASIDEAEQVQLEHVQGSVLQKTTLTPGGVVQGFFVIDAPARRKDESTIEISVAVAGDRSPVQISRDEGQIGTIDAEGGGGDNRSC